MDPITGFASIVGLISIFKQERKAREEQNCEAFFRWLDEHRHQELKEFILRSQELRTEVDRILQEDHEVILAKLERIDELLAALLSRVRGISGMATAIHPQAGMSEQAVSILRQLVDSGATEFGKIPHMDGVSMPLTSGGGQIEVDDIRFLDDDLNTLVSRDILLLRIAPSGSEFYGITRNAAKYIEAVDGRTRS